MYGQFDKRGILLFLRELRELWILEWFYKFQEFNEWQISFILNELIEFNTNEIQHVADSA